MDDLPAGAADAADVGGRADSSGTTPLREERGRTPDTNTPDMQFAGPRETASPGSGDVGGQGPGDEGTPGLPADGAGREPPPGGPAGRRVVRGILAWSLLAGWVIWALARIAALDRSAGTAIPVVPLISFTPYVAATAPLPLIAALLLRRRRAAIVAGVTAVVLAVTVLPRAIPAPQPTATGPRLRVLSANLLFGRADLDRLVSLVRQTRADVLSLQELPDEAVAGLDRAGLSRLMPYRHLDVRERGFGAGLYSRHPLRPVVGRQPGRVAMPRAEVTLPGGRVVEVTAVHPLPPISDDAHRKWLRYLGDLPGTAAGREPVRLLVGDFNATLDHRELRRLLDRGYVDAADQRGQGIVPTWGVARGGPPLTIDHVLVQTGCAVTRFRILDLPGSDHRPVFAELRLP